MDTTFDNYATAYSFARLTRRDGILQVRLGTDESPLVWGATPHQELPKLLYEIGQDPDNLVVILTGTGPEFMTQIDRDSWGPQRETAPVRDRMQRDARLLLQNLLDIPVPVIGAINGPARLHAEIPLLSDVVIASRTTVFQDTAHFFTGGVPGDGVNVLWPMWLGANRGRDFLLNSREIDAEKALELGLVAEVVEPSEVLDRAWVIAAEFIKRPRLTLRYTRASLTLPIKRHLSAFLESGIALQFLARAYPAEALYPWVEHPDRQEEDE